MNMGTCMCVGESVCEGTGMFMDGFQALDGSEMVCKMFACIFVFFSFRP